MKAIVVTKVSLSFIDSPPHISIKKQFFNTHSDTIAHDSAYFDWKRIPEWRWSDDWVITGMKRIENVSSPWRKYFSRQKANMECLSGAFPTSNSCDVSAFTGFWSKTQRNWERIEWLASGTEVTRFASKLELKKSERQKVSISDLIYRKHSRSFEVLVWGTVPGSPESPTSHETKFSFVRGKLKGNKFPICCHKFMQQKHKIIDLLRCPFPFHRTAAGIASKTRHFGAGTINSLLCCVARLLWSLSSLVLSVANQQFDDISWRPQGDKRIAAIVLETAMTTSQAIFV